VGLPVDKKSLLSAVLTAILIGGLILVETMRFGTVQAESTMPKPSAPEFSVKHVSHPYYVQPTTSIPDPYTGAVTTYPGYLDMNMSVEVTIKNQPFTSVQMLDGNMSRLYYNIRYHGHFAVTDMWSYCPISPSDGYINASNSEYTVVSLSPLSYGVGDQVDYQVQALIGYDEPKYSTGILGDQPPYFVGYHFTGEASDWSTQTLTIAPTPSLAPTPSQEPQQTEQIETILATVIVIAVIVAGLGLLIYLVKRK
jgi:hypothetical protein